MYYVFGNELNDWASRGERERTIAQRLLALLVLTSIEEAPDDLICVRYTDEDLQLLGRDQEFAELDAAIWDCALATDPEVIVTVASNDRNQVHFIVDLVDRAQP